ncbi:BREX-1 system adenine-specific DNA-methyltransferase PglX [uncultured Prevotella sp.]|uniref:BREX-1 system adenine-specific DNA-methyltransferase PglX n=1 Tax=uncultured Prevotella sp. TaxID=159272 RepID=UPI0026052764|nr:BREX-1 system adenine-specific DNA-methyltransferase PglX [uncultured Prevotella sp.]
MDTNRLKRFATEARNILMQGVKNRLQAIGFDLKTGKPPEMPQKMEGGAVFMGDTVTTDFYSRWMSLYNNICARGIKQVAEEAAYTWFNRFMAIRIMQKQGFISPVLAYESEEVRVPVIVSEARQGRMPQMVADVHDKLMELLDDDSKTNEQFALLIVAYCHENPIINKCFGAIADYTELLLPQNILAEGGFVSMLNDSEFITDNDFRSAELIGWLYQFYISDRKDEAFAKKGKYDADEIAPATQIFTPNWIVKYMVENTVGRIYIDNNPYCEAKDEMKYLVDTPSGDEALKVDDLAELTVADLACGSGHILNECFDLLYSLYVEEGYSRSQAISNILRKNILGIDLDTRAKQLATFALLMKACQKDNSFLDGKVMPRIYDMPRPIAEAIGVDDDTCNAEEYLKETLPHYLLGGNADMVQELTDAILLMDHANTLGSIMKFDISEQTRNVVMVRTQEYEEQLANGEIVPSSIMLLMPYMRIILALTQKYAALCMNPPYMGSGRFDEVLSKYVKDNYEEGKSDLFSVFMQMGMERLAPNGKMAQINMQSWMFLSSFEKLRKQFLTHYNIDNMLHLGPRTFDELSGEVVQNTAFVLCKHVPVEQGGVYYRLVEGKNCADKEQLFLSQIHGNEEGNRIYYNNVEQKNFEKIPGSLIGYWASEKLCRTFQYATVNDKASVVIGIKTGDNNKFLRLWFEVEQRKEGILKTDLESINDNGENWFPNLKGGEYRKWYGNLEYVIDWERHGKNMLEHINSNGISDARIRPSNFAFYLNNGITWSRIGSGKISLRYIPKGCFFDCNSPSIFSANYSIESIMAILNSKVSISLLEILAPTLTFQIADIKKIPLPEEKVNKPIIQQNIAISKSDWDAHETSWDFQRNELLSIDEDTYMENINYEVEKHFEETGEHICIDPAAPQLDSLAWRIEQYKQKWEHKFKQLHENEEELNRQFIDIYGLQDELTPDVPLNEITILQQGEISIE